MMINQAKTENVGNEQLVTVDDKETMYWVNMKEALDRLQRNEDFKKVILDGYFKDKAVNGVSLLATDYVRQNGLRPVVMESLVAISQLEDYFATIQSMGTIDNESDEE